MGSGMAVMRGTPTSRQRALGALATTSSPGRAAFALADPTANASPLAPPPCQIPDMSGFPPVVRGTGGFAGLDGFFASSDAAITSDANIVMLRIASVYRICYFLEPAIEFTVCQKNWTCLYTACSRIRS